MKQLKIVEPTKGFKYLFGEELAIINNVQKDCRKILVKNGFNEIITPFLVDYNLVVGDENQPVSTAKAAIVFDFKSANGERLALRYENTLPVCKFYVDNLLGEKNKVQKLFYISPQFRNEIVTDVNSRLRQFYQIGWEVIGGKKPTYVTDSIMIGISMLWKLKIRYQVKISEVNILSDIFDKLKLTRKQKHTLLLIIDDRNNDELNKFLKEVKLKDYQTQLIKSVMTVTGDPDLVFGIIKPLLIKNGNSKTLLRLKKLAKIYKDLKRTKNGNIKIDLSLVRSNKFYSGIIFQYYVGDIDHECGGGGEYNRVIKSLGGPETISSGGAFGFERVMYEYLSNYKNG
ncbi:ATP phosphoribosyltransferase regulatory subunit [Patescibacteria group bacterium]|nr:ATP phosphoribosyltransferase regulatory subunit [Patescibacteria group bacterium]MBU2036495.1 ATP phosphoribosyltransferase regulatory subunit [Patescibacteria group bacterium]